MFIKKTTHPKLTETFSDGSVAVSTKVTRWIFYFRRFMVQITWGHVQSVKEPENEVQATFTEQSKTRH